MRDHRNLKVFELADALVLEVYRETQSFPSSERYGLVTQLRRAAVSVPTNIVEGCGRGTGGELRRFLRIAFASLREVGYLIGLSHRLGLLTDAESRRLLARYDETARTLAGLIKSL